MIHNFYIIQTCKTNGANGNADVTVFESQLMSQAAEESIQRKFS